MQLAASILFFYVFGLAAVLMTWYVGRIITQYIQEGREQQRKRKRLSSDTPQDSVKLHISEGLIQVNRLPEEQGKAEE